MSNTNANLVSAPACPLAIDPDGNVIELPSDAAAWRVRRHTGGRPRIQLGVDKQPMQLPLGYTLADLEDILPPGAYRLDLVDGKGEPLGITVPIAIGQLRNADGDDAHDGDDTPVGAPALLSHATSDTRLVLEANVRSTQMAFQHNQKTLELGLRMAETLRDGVHVLVDAQADWIKSLAASRGFYRNAAPPQLPAPERAEQDDDDDDDSDDEDEPAPAAAQDWVEKLGPLVAIVAQQVVAKLSASFTKPAAGGSKFELADLFNWNRAHAKATANRAEKPPTASLAAAPNPMALLGSIPPALLQKVMQVRDMLAPDEQQRAMQLLMAIDPADLPGVIAQLEPMTPEQLAEFLRAQIAKMAA